MSIRSSFDDFSLHTIFIFIYLFVLSIFFRCSHGSIAKFILHGFCFPFLFLSSFSSRNEGCTLQIHPSAVPFINNASIFWLIELPTPPWKLRIWIEFLHPLENTKFQKHLHLLDKNALVSRSQWIGTLEDNECPKNVSSNTIESFSTDCCQMNCWQSDHHTSVSMRKFWNSNSLDQEFLLGEMSPWRRFFSAFSLLITLLAMHPNTCIHVSLRKYEKKCKVNCAIRSWISQNLIPVFDVYTWELPSKSCCYFIYVYIKINEIRKVSTTTTKTSSNLPFCWTKHSYFY